MSIYDAKTPNPAENYEAFLRIQDETPNLVKKTDLQHEISELAGELQNPRGSALFRQTEILPPAEQQEEEEKLTKNAENTAQSLDSIPALSVPFPISLEKFCLLYTSPSPRD